MSDSLRAVTPLLHRGSRREIIPDAFCHDGQAAQCEPASGSPPGLTCFQGLFGGSNAAALYRRASVSAPGRGDDIK